MLKAAHYVVYKQLNRLSLNFFTTITARIIIIIIIEDMTAVQYILLFWL